MKSVCSPYNSSDFGLVGLQLAKIRSNLVPLMAIEFFARVIRIGAVTLEANARAHAEAFQPKVSW